MSERIPLTTTRTTRPDDAAMLTAIKQQTADPSAVLLSTDGIRWIAKKQTAWTAGQTAAAQSILDTIPALTPQLEAQRQVDAWPIMYRALVLAIIDALNVIRAALPTPLPAITPTQAITAIRNKAATL